MLRRTVVLFCALGVALPQLTACAEEAPQVRAAAPAAPAAAPPVLKQDATQIARTAGSLRQVDDLPLYEMTYHGGYDAEAPLTEDELARRGDGWACSLFLRGAPKPEFGRNFDWDPNPAMVVRADPPGGYASLSVVDISYLLNRGGPPDLVKDRRRLAHAVLAPFDGMNEKGLAVGFASTPDADLPAPLAGRPAVSSLRIVRLLLDRAATVEEALALMRAYTVNFDGGPQVHYLIADAGGASAVVEYGQGRMNVIKDRILTNITMTGTDRAARLADTRYRTLADGVPTKADGLELLKRVAQGHTRWSVVYDLKAGTARLVTGKRWDRVHHFKIAG